MWPVLYSSLTRLFQVMAYRCRQHLQDLSQLWVRKYIDLEHLITCYSCRGTWDRPQRLNMPEMTYQVCLRTAIEKEVLNCLLGLSNKHTNLVSHRRESIVPTTPISGQPTLGAVPRRFFNSATLPRPSNATLPTGGHRTPFVSQSLDRRQNSGFRPA